MSDALSPEEREKLLARMRALAAKTIENGCTESEALAAAEKLAEMAHRYDISMSEVEFRKSEFRRETYPTIDDVGVRLTKVSREIAQLTGAKTWMVRERSIVFFGRDSDVAVATYMLAICERAVRTELETYSRTLALFVASRRSACRSPSSTA